MLAKKSIKYFDWHTVEIYNVYLRFSNPIFELSYVLEFV